jgi:GMP synthase (glutamine-hydrolysing)
VRQALVLQHAPHEGPGRIAPLLEARGFRLAPRALFAGEAVPERLEPGDVLVVMGGAMGVADLGSPDFPFLRAELALLERCVADDAPVLGVCLGAQLVAAAAGARVAPMTRPDGTRVLEVGWGEVDFQLGEVDDLPARAPMLHWHGDAFELPAGARRLASTAICANQGFQLRTRLFGLQFHPEVSEADIESFVREDAAYAARALGPDAAERIRRDTRAHLATSARTSELLLGWILDTMSR